MDTEQPMSSESSAADGRASMSALMPLLYEELRALAADQLRRQPGATIQPTALVHEAYLKMAPQRSAWKDREHFLATAAKAMRHVLIDRLRKRSTEKRGGGAARSAMDVESISDDAVDGLRSIRLLELDDLLLELARADARAAAAAEMRLFGGMDQSQIARVQGVSRTIVASDWQFTRAWLAGRMNGGSGEVGGESRGGKS